MPSYSSGDLWPVQVRIYQAHLEQRALAQGLAERAARQTQAEQPPAPTATASPPPVDGLLARVWRRVYWLWLLATWRMTWRPAQNGQVRP